MMDGHKNMKDNTHEDQKGFDNLQEQLYLSAVKMFKLQSIAREIVNQVILDIALKQDMKPVADIQTVLEQAAEPYFNELWMFCYRYAVMLVKRDDAAQDIAAEAIASLYKCKCEVEFIKGWLKRTVFNQAQNFLKREHRDSELEALKAAENIVNDVPLDENELDKKLSPKDIRKYLSKADYGTYQKIRSYPNLKSYAEAEGINHQSARQHKQRVMHNLKRNYLVAHGWMGTPIILSYRQLANIHRFLKTLVDSAKTGSLSKLSKYCSKALIPKFEETMYNLKEVSDWGITSAGGMHYELLILDASGFPKPLMYILNISINKGNAIRITAFRQARMMSIIPAEQAPPIPVEKGVCPLSLEEIKQLLHM